MVNQPFKVIVTFNRVGEARFSTKAELIVASLMTPLMRTLVSDPLSFGSRPAIQKALDDYLDAARRAKDSKSAIKERIQKRKTLERMLKGLAVHLELSAEKADDITILMRSGFDLRRPSVKHRYNGVPNAPIIIVKRGAVSGSVVIRVKPLLPGINTYEAQYAVGAARADGNFQPGITVTRGRMELARLAVAQWHQFRVRGHGYQGPGDWSNPVSIIVT